MSDHRPRLASRAASRSFWPALAVVAIVAGVLQLSALPSSGALEPASIATPSANRIDIAVLGDGYTAAQLGKFHSDVDTAMNGFFAQEPFHEYERYFVTHMVDVTSNQSGADHPENSPATFVDTALGASYNCAGIVRLICVDQSAVHQALNAQLDPADQDIILVLVNDTKYGGSGGAIGVASLDPSVVELVLHELGHSFGGLGDEYADGTCTLNDGGYANVTAETARANIKWNHWIDASTVLPTTSTTAGLPGLYEGARFCPTGLYRPTFNSKMRSLGLPFEQVNTEQLIRRIYNVVSPIDATSPSATSVSIPTGTSQAFSVTPLAPLTHSLLVTWTLDGATVGTSTTYSQPAAGLTAGMHTLAVQVSDPTGLVRSDPESLLKDQRTWQVFTNVSAPANDAFASPTGISGPAGSTTGTNVGATKEVGEPDHTSSGGASVWWRWTAPADGTVDITTAGSSFDTMMAIYPNACCLTGLIGAAGNDDENYEGGILTSRVDGLSVVAGAKYLIAIDGYAGATGSIRLSWNFHGATVATGLLRVATSPALPADIVVDGIARDSWGLSWVSFPVGSHEVCFEPVPGFQAPACSTVNVTQGNTSTVVGTFTPNGFLRVMTSPAAASTISVDGVARNDWGLWTEIAPGTHTVCFGAVAGVAVPGCRSVAVSSGATATTTGTLTPDGSAPGPAGPFGLLRATTDPPVGAMITVDGSARNNWGLEWVKLTPGSHQVCFGKWPNVIAPVSCSAVTVVEGATTSVTGTYAAKGFLRVITSPAVAATITVDGEIANAYGVWTSKEVGTHTVCFGPVAGFTAPACQTAPVTAGNTTTVTGTYS